MKYPYLALAAVLLGLPACHTDLNGHLFRCASNADCINGHVCATVAPDTKACVVPGSVADVGADADAADGLDGGRDTSADVDASTADAADAGDTADTGPVTPPECHLLANLQQGDTGALGWGEFSHANTNNYKGLDASSPRNIGRTAGGTLFEVQLSSVSIQDKDGAWRIFDRTNSPLVPPLFVGTADPDGGLWVAGAFGLYHLTCAGSWSSVAPPDNSDQLGAVNGMAIAADGDMWLSRPKKSLLRYKDHSFSEFSFDDLNLDPTVETVYDVAIDPTDDVVAVGSTAGVIHVSRVDQPKVLDTASAPGNAHVVALDYASDGTLWAATSDGAAVDDGSGLKLLGGSASGAASDVSVVTSSRGYFAGSTIGIVEDKDGQVTRLDDPSQVLDFATLDVFADADNIYATGPWTYKLAHYNGAEWKADQPYTDGLMSNAVQVIAPGPNGGAWMGSTVGVSYRDAGGTWNNFEMPSDLRIFHLVTALTVVSKTEFYLGNEQGAVHYKDGTWDKVGDLAGARVAGIAYAAGAVWFGITTTPSSSAPLYVHRSDGSWDKPTEPLSGIGDSVTTMTMGSGDATIVLGASGPNLAGGIGVRDQSGQWSTYTTEEMGVPKAKVNDIAVDATGTIYVATSEGIAIGSTTSATPYDTWKTLTPADPQAVPTPPKVTDIALAGGRVWVRVLKDGPLFGAVVGYFEPSAGNDSYTWHPVRTGFQRLLSDNVSDITTVDQQVWFAHPDSGVSVDTKPAQ